MSLACAGAVGCGNSSSHTQDGDGAGAGGAGATGGSGGSGGSSGNAERPAAALRFTLLPPSALVPNLGARTCNAPAGGHYTYLFGMPEETISDGITGITVECAVSGGIVDGSLSVATGNDDPTTFSLSGSALSSSSGGGVGYVTFYSPRTGSLAVPDGFPACTLGPTPTLKEGAILTDFSCPLLGVVGDDSSGCDAAGTVAFEYCKAGEEEP